MTERISRITVPQKAHPFAKLVFEMMRRTNTTYDEMEYKSGVLRSTVKAWRGDNLPGLDTIAACLGAVGCTLLVAPPRSHVPADIQEKLDALAAEWEGRDATFAQLLATVAHAPLVNVRYDDMPEKPVKPVKWPKRPRKGYISPGQAALL